LICLAALLYVRPQHHVAASLLPKEHPIRVYVLLQRENQLEMTLPLLLLFKRHQSLQIILREHQVALLCRNYLGLAAATRLWTSLNRFQIFKPQLGCSLKLGRFLAHLRLGRLFANHFVGCLSCVVIWNSTVGGLVGWIETKQALLIRFLLVFLQLLSIKQMESLQVEWITQQQRLYVLVHWRWTT